MEKGKFMNLTVLKEQLKSWLCIDTWHSLHPCDNKRFHIALNNAFTQLGNAISYDDFHGAMMELAQEYNYEHRERELEYFAGRAENISNYLFDTSNNGQ